MPHGMGRGSITRVHSDRAVSHGRAPLLPQFVEVFVQRRRASSLAVKAYGALSVMARRT